LVLLFTGIRARLHWAQWAVMGTYLVYLLPYIVVSYYERYTLPLLGVKVVLVAWAVDRLLALWPRRTTVAGPPVVAPADAGRLGSAAPETPSPVAGGSSP